MPAKREQQLKDFAKPEHKVFPEKRATLHPKKEKTLLSHLLKRAGLADNEPSEPVFPGSEIGKVQPIGEAREKTSLTPVPTQSVGSQSKQPSIVLPQSGKNMSKDQSHIAARESGAPLHTKEPTQSFSKLPDGNIAKPFSKMKQGSIDYSRNTGVADVDGEIYVNGNDVELLGKLGFEYSESDYNGLEKTSEALDLYSYIEKVAGVPKEVAKLIDAGQAFSGEYLKDMGYKLPKGYEVKGDLVCRVEKTEQSFQQTGKEKKKSSEKTAATPPGSWTTSTGSWHRSGDSLVDPKGRVMTNTPNGQPMVESPYADITQNVVLNVAGDLASRAQKLVTPTTTNVLKNVAKAAPLPIKAMGWLAAKAAVPAFNAAVGAADTYNRWEREDYPGAAISGAGVGGDLAQLAPTPLTKGIGAGVSWASTGANAARDLHRYNNRPVEFRNTPPSISQPSAPQPTQIQQPLQLLAKESSADPAQTILITGHSGSGKTTLSRQLAEKLGIPVRRVDAHRGWDNYIRGDDKRWKETLTPGTKEHSYFTNLVNRATRDTLKNAPTAGIIEGTQLGHLSPEELAKFKAHIVAGGTRDQSIAQRIQRSVDKASKQGITFSPEEMAAKKIKAEYVANFWEPGVEKFRKLPGALNYNHSEHQIDPLVEQLKQLMGKQAEHDRKGMQTETYKFEGDVQGVHLRKELHNILDKMRREGLAVNYPETNEVYATLEGRKKYTDSILDKLKKVLSERKERPLVYGSDYNISHVPSMQEKLKPVKFTKEHLMAFVKRNAEIKSLQSKAEKDQFDFVGKRYRLKPNQHGELEGMVPGKAYDQLINGAPSYSFQIHPQTDILGKQAASIGSLGRLGKALGVKGYGKIMDASRGAFDNFSSLGKSVPPGALHTERMNALNTGNKLLEDFKPDGFKIYSGRVKTPDSLAGHGNQVTNDMLGFRVTPKNGYGEDSANALADQLRQQGINVTKQKKLVRDGYHGWNIAGEMPGANGNVPVEFQMTPRRMQGVFAANHMYNYKPETSGVNPAVGKYIYKPVLNYLTKTMSPMSPMQTRVGYGAAGLTGVGGLGAGAYSLARPGGAAPGVTSARPMAQPNTQPIAMGSPQVNVDTL